MVNFEQTKSDPRTQFTDEYRQQYRDYPGCFSPKISRAPECAATSPCVPGERENELKTQQILYLHPPDPHRKSAHFRDPFGAIFDAFLSHFWVVNFRPPELQVSNGDLVPKIDPKNCSKTRRKSRRRKRDTARDLRARKWSMPGERVSEMAQKCPKKGALSGH